MRRHVVDHYTHVRELIRDRLAPTDAAALDILLDEKDPCSLQRRADVFLLSAATAHLAHRDPTGR